MSPLELLKRGAQVKGIHPSGAVTVLDVVELTYRDEQLDSTPNSTVPSLT